MVKFHESQWRSYRILRVCGCQYRIPRIRGRRHRISRVQLVVSPQLRVLVYVGSYDTEIIRTNFRALESVYESRSFNFSFIVSHVRCIL